MKRLLLILLFLPVLIFAQSRYFQNTTTTTTTIQQIDFNGLVKEIIIIADIVNTSDTLYLWSTQNPTYEDKILLTANFNIVSLPMQPPIPRIWLQTNGATIRRTIIARY